MKGNNTLTMSEHRYSMKSTGRSSDKYGPCEVCSKRATEVFHQIEQRKYKSNAWTRHNCHDLFGHKSCLIKQRKQ